MGRKTRNKKPTPKPQDCVCDACGAEAKAYPGRPHRKCPKRRELVTKQVTRVMNGEKVVKQMTTGGGPLGVWQ